MAGIAWNERPRLMIKILSIHKNLTKEHVLDNGLGHKSMKRGNPFIVGSAFCQEFSKLDLVDYEKQKIHSSTKWLGSTSPETKQKQTY